MRAPRGGTHVMAVRSDQGCFAVLWELSVPRLHSLGALEAAVVAAAAVAAAPAAPPCAPVPVPAPPAAPSTAPTGSTVEQCAHAMGLDVGHMGYASMANALPPAYISYVFGQMAMHVARERYGILLVG